jgi:dolichyl-phosphate-mannose-protein mannosyltransferase
MSVTKTHEKPTNQLAGYWFGVKNSFAFLLSTALILIVGFSIRLFNATKFKVFMQDEFYYVKDGWSVFRYGYEVKWIEDAFNLPSIISGLNASNHYFYNNITPVPYSLEYWSGHPPVGKWLIGLGMQLFGFSEPLGWRFSAVVAGTIIIGLTIWLAFQVFNNKTVALVAGLMVAVDGFAVSMSIISMLDIFLTLFVLLTINLTVFFVQKHKILSPPKLFMLVAVIGLTSGLAAGVKWVGVFAILPFGFFLLKLFATNNKGRFKKIGFVALSGSVMIVTYIVSFTGWFVNSPEGLKNYSLYDSLTNLWVYHVDNYSKLFIFSGSSHLKSTPTEWVTAAHPSFFVAPDSPWTYFISTIPNLIVWYAGWVGVLIALTVMLKNRKASWVKLTPILAVVCLIAPWLNVGDRIIYQWYAIVVTPFIIIFAAKLFVALFLKSKLVSLSLTTLTVVLALVLHPINTGLNKQQVNTFQQQSLNYLESWNDFTLKTGLRDYRNTAIYFRPDVQANETVGSKIVFINLNGVTQWVNIPVRQNNHDNSNAKPVDTGSLYQYNIFAEANPDLTLFEEDGEYFFVERVN